MIAMEAESMAMEGETRYTIVSGLNLTFFKPMPKHLVVRWLGRKETKHGILMPQTRERCGVMSGIILAMGKDCDVALEVGQKIQFGSFTEKEFIGPECPADRDPVFFMAEMDVIGYIQLEPLTYLHGGTLMPINKNLFVKPDLEVAEKSGLTMINRDQKQIMRSGVVMRYDDIGLLDEDVKTGDRVFYHSATAEEVKLGDFTAELIHVVKWNSVELVVQNV